MKIVNIKVADLKPYLNNPRRNDRAVEAVAESIKQFGFRVPIVITTGGTLITGHTRLKAAQKLGLDEIPCLIAGDLTDSQIKAYRLADNKVGEVASWNEELLQQELSALALDFDFQALGFSHKDLEGILTFPEDEEYSESLPTNIGHTPSYRTKKGEIWALGNHRLMIDDSTDKTAVAKLLRGITVDLWLTDPPYNVDVSNSQGMKIANDNLSDAAFVKFLTAAFSAVAPHLKKGGGILHMARHLISRCIQGLTKSRQDISAETLPSVGQRHIHSIDERLQLSARTMLLRLDRRSSQILHIRCHPRHGLPKAAQHHEQARTDHRGAQMERWASGGRHHA